MAEANETAKSKEKKKEERPPVEIYCGDYRCRRCNMPMAWASVNTMKCNTLGCLNQNRQVEIPVVRCTDV